VLSAAAHPTLHRDTTTLVNSENHEILSYI